MSVVNSAVVLCLLEDGKQGLCNCDAFKKQTIKELKETVKRLKNCFLIWPVITLPQNTKPIELVALRVLRRDTTSCFTQFWRIVNLLKSWTDTFGTHCYQLHWFATNCSCNSDKRWKISNTVALYDTGSTISLVDDALEKKWLLKEIYIAGLNGTKRFSYWKRGVNVEWSWIFCEDYVSSTNPIGYKE